MFRLIAEGVLRTASVKENLHSTRGIRLIDRHSLDVYLEELCASLEEKLITQSNELAQREQELAQQQAELAKAQRATKQELEKVRKRRRGGPLPSPKRQ